ncbi:hypothetical protein ACQKGL_10725 [Ensifer adhaerens]|uniref:hypothetical protein n=1 Tax=Ensifer adhaerens TaxID=106592 RepID=UPI003D051777
MKILASLAVTATAAAWFIRDGLQGSTPWLVVGCIFALWAVFIALGLIRRRVVLTVSETGLVVNRIIRSPAKIQWSQIEIARIPEAGLTALIGWRASPKAKLQFAGVSQRSLGEAGIKTLSNALFAARPDLRQETSVAAKSATV